MRRWGCMREPIQHCRSRPHSVNDEECYALRQLQKGASPPPASFAVWEYLRVIGLVWIDDRVQPPAVHLTADGQSYPTRSRR
jgi:hypothetical protein